LDWNWLAILVGFVVGWGRPGGWKCDWRFGGFVVGWGRPGGWNWLAILGGFVGSWGAPRRLELIGGFFLFFFWLIRRITRKKTLGRT